MHKITEVLRLHFEHDRTNREIALAIGTSPTTVGQYLRRAREAGIGYPLPEGLDDAAIESRLFPPVVSSSVIVKGSGINSCIVFVDILQRKGK